MAQPVLWSSAGTTGTVARPVLGARPNRGAHRACLAARPAVAAILAEEGHA
jgi:hypothetical protein